MYSPSPLRWKPLWALSLNGNLVNSGLTVYVQGAAEKLDAFICRRNPSETAGGIQGEKAKSGSFFFLRRGKNRDDNHRLVHGHCWQHFQNINIQRLEEKGFLTSTSNRVLQKEAIHLMRLWKLGLSICAQLVSSLRILVQIKVCLQHPVS